jgi:hypothetical protein
MGRINWARILLAGLLAGMIANAFEYFLHTQILEKPWVELRSKLAPPASTPPPATTPPPDSTPGSTQNSKPLTATPTTFAGYALSSFLAGGCVVWLYAAIRPRFKSTGKAALSAAIVTWIPTYCGTQLALLLSGVLPGAIVFPTMVVGLIELIAAVAVAVLVYQDTPPAPQISAVIAHGAEGD